MDPITPEARERLGAFMEERAYDLGLSWREVASRARISYETIRALRSGSEGGIRPLTARKLDRALEWQPGSVQRILTGGDPEPVDPLLDEEQVARNFAVILRMARQAEEDAEREAGNNGA